MMGPIMHMMGKSVKSMLESPKKQLENQLAKVLEQHDGTAIGMTHSALRDLVYQLDAVTMFMSSSGGQNTDFSTAAAAFEIARQTASSEERREQVREVLRKTLVVVDRYVT